MLCGLAAFGAVRLSLTGGLSHESRGEAEPRRERFMRRNGKAEPFGTGSGKAAGGWNS
jgi:hypothetical protein